MKLIYDKELGAWIDNWFTKHRYYHPHSKSTSIPISELKDIVEQMPSADAVEVVRCMDCKWRDKAFCNALNIHGIVYDDFCSFGIRKE